MMPWNLVAWALGKGAASALATLEIIARSPFGERALDAAFGPREPLDPEYHPEWLLAGPLPGTWGAV